MRRLLPILVVLLKSLLLAFALLLLCFVLTMLSVLALQRGWRWYNARPTSFLLAGGMLPYIALRVRPAPATRAWLRSTGKGRACLVAGACAILAPCVWVWSAMLAMPGTSFSGPLDPLTPPESALRDALRRDVLELSENIGMRNLPHSAALDRATEFLERSLRESGHAVRRRSFPAFGREFHNVEAELRGTDAPGEIVIVGGHYDTAEDAPGADDNATGAAAVVALARAFAGRSVARTVRFVAFTNEEPPHFKGPTMGSLVYAKECEQHGDRITAMLSLEMLGFYSDAMGSQAMPFPLSLFYPSTGDFLAVAGDTGSAPLVRAVLGSFRRNARFPSEGAAVPAFIPGIDWSDHWSFWQCGFPGVIVTDTALFRNPHYHQQTDTADRLDFDRMARVVAGLEKVVGELAGAK